MQTRPASNVSKKLPIFSVASLSCLLTSSTFLFAQKKYQRDRDTRRRIFVSCKFLRIIYQSAIPHQNYYHHFPLIPAILQRRTCSYNQLCNFSREHPCCSRFPACFVALHYLFSEITWSITKTVLVITVPSTCLECS